MEKLHIAVLFGGRSSEYGISLQSASAVIKHMNRDRFVPVMIGITADGGWFYFNGDVDLIAEDTWHCSKECKPAFFSPDAGEHSLNIVTDNGIEKISIDAAFPVLHGKNGEDGTVQGLLQLSGIPIVGCGVLASALCMDKDRAHKLVKEAGIEVPQAFVLHPEYDEDYALKQAEAIGFPVFVKPVKAGSSYGISKVFTADDFIAAITEAFTYDNEVIVEENIDGFEVGCAVLGNEELVVGAVDEIELQRGFFDFTEKYGLITSQIHVPARIAPEKAAEIKETAKRIYRALGCGVFARVDMFLMPSGRIVFNEVNTIPGFTSHSRFPNMMKEVGISFAEVIERAIMLAIEG